MFIRIRTDGPCRDEVEYNYTIETVNDPVVPDIIYRNVAQKGREVRERFKIFQNDGTWFNNTVCQDDSDVPPDNPAIGYQFAACYSNN